MNPWLEPLTRRRRYTTAPRTWVPGELVTAGMMNTLRDQLLEIEAGTAAIKGTTTPFAAVDSLRIVHSGSGYGYEQLYSGAGSDTYFYQFAAGYASGSDALAGGLTIRTMGAGGITLSVWDAAAPIKFMRNQGSVLLGMFTASGGLSLFGAADPGVGNMSMGVGTFTIGTTHGASLGYLPGVDYCTFTSRSPAAVSYPGFFYNVNGNVGYIITNGLNTGYATSSDQRLKLDRGQMTETDVLSRIVIHAFNWIADGVPGRGVFAQEAIDAAPFAVFRGTDERDEDGKLARPWGVDYAKFVPDLIVGWQQHERVIATLMERITALEAAK